MFHQARHRTSGCYSRRPERRRSRCLSSQILTKEAHSMGTHGLMGRRTLTPNAVHVNNVMVVYSAYHFIEIIV